MRRYSRYDDVGVERELLQRQKRPDVCKRDLQIKTHLMEAFTYMHSLPAQYTNIMISTSEHQHHLA
jgi:hypothetical protein